MAMAHTGQMRDNLETRCAPKVIDATEIFEERIGKRWIITQKAGYRHISLWRECQAQVAAKLIHSQNLTGKFLA
jgi:hypothetical protein